MEFTKLNNGVEMPMQGIGTFLLFPDEAEASATYALKNGCQLIDTANAYCNEKAVGRAIKNAGIDRKNIFLETKLWSSFYEQDDAVDKTLDRLQTDYIDLLLIRNLRIFQTRYSILPVPEKSVSDCLNISYCTAVHDTLHSAFHKRTRIH